MCRGMLKGMVKTRKTIPSTKYDVVVIGSNMGAVLGRHIQEITKGNTSVFIADAQAST